MTRNIRSIKGLAILLIFSLALALLAGCSGGKNETSSPSSSASTASSPAASESSSPSESTEPTPTPVTPITLKVQLSSTGEDFENTDVYNEIVKQTGVTMDIELFDEQKFQVELAGGDLPDIIQVKHVNTTYLQQLIDGGNIIPLDDLVQSNGPAILSPVYEKSVNYSKTFWSNNTGKLYLVPVQIGSTGWGFDQGMGFVTRWDYYKELGYPQIKNMDDMVNVLADMVAKHPKTADGKKVYGVSIWNDWGTWGLGSLGFVTGNGTYNVNTGKLANNYTDPTSSNLWDTAYFMYKAQQKGILDPDAFTAKYDDIVAKATQGTLLYSTATWPFSNVNAELLKEGPDKGFVTIPLDWGFSWVSGTTVAGWGDRGYAITKNCKDPARAMDLINFLVSEQGSRLIQSGVQGVHWDMVDGKPQMKPELVQLRTEGGDAWKKTGINMAANQQGLTNNTVVSSDGGLVNLFNTTEAFAAQAQASTLFKDYDEHYGATYPAEAYKKFADAGQVKTLDQMPQDAQNAMAGMPEDIKRIQAKLEDIVTKGIPEVVLKAKDDADYTKRQNALIAKLNDAGADQWFQWYSQAFTEAQAKVGS